MTPGDRGEAVEWFAERMLEKLCEPRNVAKGSWRGCDLSALLAACDGELLELAEELRANTDGHANYEAIIKEAADVANYALMIADVCRQLQPRR